MSWCPKKSVIVPIDFSEESFSALDVGLELAEGPERLHIVHVLQDLSPLEAGEVWGVIDPQARIDGAKRALREKLSTTRFANVSAEVMLGDPATCIAHYAQDLKADLIVLPSHGRTGLTRLLIGSTAERVVRLAHCPVLVLRK
jgi:nucleotide-binding universal stress UspA family protein